MSDPVLDALTQRARGATASGEGADPVLDALNQRSLGVLAGDPPDAKTAMTTGMWNQRLGEMKGETDLYKGAGEAALQFVTGFPAALGGGLTYLGALGTTFDPNAAKAVQEATQSALTYQPRTDMGRRISSGIGDVMDVAFGAKAARESGEDITDKTGSPFLGAMANLVNQAPSFLLGIKGGRAAEAGIREAFDTPPAPRSGAFADSVGASAVVPNLDRAPLDLRAAIEKGLQDGTLNRDAANAHLDAATLPIPVRLTRGQATGDAALISREQNLRATMPEIQQVLTEQSPLLAENLDAIRTEVAPTVVGNDHIQNGQALIDAYKTYDAPVVADIRAKYKALEDANGGQFPVAGADFVASADAALAKKMKGRYVPREIAADLEEFRSGGPMTFEQFENLRTNLAAESRKAERAGDGNAAMAISIVRESLESLPMTGEAAALKPIADAARKAAKDRFDALREDPAYRAAVEDSAEIGELSPLADQFVPKYILKGKSAHIKKMREKLGSDQTASETISASALNYLKSKAGINPYTNEGNFSAAGYNRALSEVLPRADVLFSPQVAEQLQQLGNVAHKTTFQPRGSWVNNSNTLVSALGEHAANAAEGIVNVKAGGLPIGTYARNKLQQRADRKFAKSSTEPGAGVVDLSSLMDRGKKKP